MEELLRYLASVKRLFVALAETGFGLVAFIVLLYLLLGADAGPYVVSVIANLTLLIDAISPQGLIAIAIVCAMIFMARRKA